MKKTIIFLQTFFIELLVMIYFALAISFEPYTIYRCNMNDGLTDSAHSEVEYKESNNTFTFPKNKNIKK